MYRIHHADCFDWLRDCEPRSLHAVRTNPPYGVLEFTGKEVAKLRAGREDKQQLAMILAEKKVTYRAELFAKA